MQVEFVSANPTGPLTVASARNAAYGDSVARLLDFAGNTVEREFYVNDGGAQIDLFHQSVDARRRGRSRRRTATRATTWASWQSSTPTPSKVMEERIRETLERFRVHMDLWVHQSEMEPLVEEALAEIELYEKEGARWLATTEWGDDKDRVVVRARTGGPRISRSTSRTCGSSGTGGTSGSSTCSGPTTTATSHA